MKIKNKLISGALVLSLGGIITKIIGAIYRVPLTNVLGAEGIGLYQMVFPLYCILLTLSSTGVPSGISKLIAEGENPYSVLKSSIIIFSGLGLISSILMAIFSEKIAVLQGNYQAKLAYLMIAPSVLLVSIISCFRGYFQGLSNMKPTAVSQIIEQVVKLVFGLVVCYFLRADVMLSSAGATLAVSVSEVVALLYLLKISKKTLKFSLIKSQKIEVKPIFMNVLPIMMATLIMPIIKTVDSFLILNIVGSYSDKATAYYGLYSGAVESIVSLPVSVCYAIAISSIPLISKAKKENLNFNKFFAKAINLTFITALFFGLMTFVFSKLAVNVLYAGLGDNNRLTTVNMLKLSSLSVLLLPLMQTTVALINAVGKYKISIISGLITAGVKVCASIILLKIPTLNVFGAILSDIVCYFVACLVNLSYIIYSGYLNNKPISAKI